MNSTPNGQSHPPKGSLISNVVDAFVVASANGSSANIGGAYDELGLCLTGVADRVVATLDPNLQPGEVELMYGGDYRGHLFPSQVEKNVAAFAAQKALILGNAPFGVRLIILKGIAPSSGKGGSAASACAAAAAVNYMLLAWWGESGPMLSEENVWRATLAGEGIAVNGNPHFDNIVPTWLGGMKGTTGDLETLQIDRYPHLPDLHLVLVHPHMELKTEDARKVMRDISRSEWAHQNETLIPMKKAWKNRDLQAVLKNWECRIATTRRKHLLLETADGKLRYEVMRDLFREAGTEAVQISGGGPSILGAFASREAAERAKDLIQARCLELNLWPKGVDILVSGISEEGVRLAETNIPRLKETLRAQGPANA